MIGKIRQTDIHRLDTRHLSLIDEDWERLIAAAGPCTIASSHPWRVPLLPGYSKRKKAG